MSLVRFALESLTPRRDLLTLLRLPFVLLANEILDEF